MIFFVLIYGVILCWSCLLWCKVTNPF